MNYPEEIIPRQNYVKPFPLNRLITKNGDYHICYRIDGPLDCFSENGTFNGKRKLLKVCFKHMPHLSMNLHGGLFQPVYVRFVQKKPGSDEWDGTRAIAFQEYEQCISEIDGAVPVFYKASVLCQKGVKTFANFDNKESYKAMRQLFPRMPFPDFEEGIVVEIETNIDIKHVPTNLNYWHVQMEVYPATSEKELSNDKVLWRQEIFEHIRDNILRLHYEVKPSLDYSIPEEMYVEVKE